MTDRDKVNQLAEAWAEAVDRYRSREANVVARELIPALTAAGAVDEASAAVVGRWAYWTRVIGGFDEVARRPVLATTTEAP